MSSDDNDKSTEQILEYYKKYSQSKNLPKYFSGSSVAYLPSIDVENDEERLAKQADRSSKHFTSQIKSTTVSELKIIVDEPKEGSPNASSPESPSEHKKLEWDNGADIGYHSARRNSEKRLHKSSSLPILDNLTNLESLLTLKPSTIIAHASSNENLGVLVFSSSSSSNRQSQNSERQAPTSSSSATPDNQQEQYLSTETSSNADVVKSKLSSNHSDSDETRFGDFQKSIDCLKQKIGLPGAQSTPNVADNVKICSSGSSKSSLPAFLSLDLNSKSSSQENQKPCGTVSNTSGSSIIELRKCDKRMESGEKSSPLKSCSSSSSRAPTKNAKKNIQTKFVELTITKPINVNCRGINVHSSNKSMQNESEVTPKAAQTETISGHHTETQFNEEKVEKKEQATTVSDLADSASSFEYISAKKPAEGTENVVKSISGVLKEITFSKSTTESSNVTQSSSEDIERYLQVLQKLCKAKKISSSTKRKYIRKLLRELSELDTSNDSNTTSSDLFIPKKDKTKSRVVFKEPVDQPACAHKCVCTKQQHSNNGSNSSTSPTCAEECIAASRLLQRHDAVDQDILSNSDHTRQSEASEKLIEDDIKILKSESSTCEKNLTIASENILASEKIPSVDKFDRTSSVLVEENSTERKEDPLNKDTTDKTLESITAKTTSFSRSNSTGDGSSKDDIVLKFAENERTYQLTWINNEINHLSKLKGMLETKKRKPTSSSRSKISNYNVAQKNSSSERKYVIETNLDVPLQQPASYILDGNEYVVTDSGKSSCEIDRAVIEIDSDEQQTNIRVSTICFACKSVECACPFKKSVSAQMECPEACSKSQQMIDGKSVECVCPSKKSTSAQIECPGACSKSQQMIAGKSVACVCPSKKSIIAQMERSEADSKSQQMITGKSVECVCPSKKSISAQMECPEACSKSQQMIDGKSVECVCPFKKSTSAQIECPGACSKSQQMIAGKSVACVCPSKKSTSAQIECPGACSKSQQMIAGKSVACVCPSKKSISAQMECPEACSKSQQMICVCNELKEANGILNIAERSEVEDVVPKTMSSTESSEETEPRQFFSTETIPQEDFNSLQKVFKKCSCTLENPNCGCDFVKKLLEKFQIQREKIDTNEDVQTDTILKDASCPIDHKKVELTNAACQTNNLCQETVVQTRIHSSQCLAVQAGVSDRHISLQTLRDSFCKCTQIDQKHKLKDTCVCTCECVATDIHKNQTSSSVDSQTLRKSSKAESIQIGRESAIVQTGKETAPVDIQTEQFDDKNFGTRDIGDRVTNGSSLCCKSTQTDQKQNLRDSCMRTCGSVATENHKCQTSSTVDSQTFEKVSKTESVQIGLESAIVQTGKETVPADVQTKQFDDKKSGASFENFWSESWVSVKPNERVVNDSQQKLPMDVEPKKPGASFDNVWSESYVSVKQNERVPGKVVNDSRQKLPKDVEPKKPGASLDNVWTESFVSVKPNERVVNDSRQKLPKDVELKKPGASFDNVWSESYVSVKQNERVPGKVVNESRQKLPKDVEPKKPGASLDNVWTESFVSVKPNERVVNESRQKLPKDVEPKKPSASFDNVWSESWVSVKPKGVDESQQILVKDVEDKSITQKGTQYTEVKQKSRSDGAIAAHSGSTSTSTPTTSTSDSRTTASSRIICYCCKQKAFLAEVSYLQQGNGDALAVCSRCYYSRPRYCSHNPRFMCRCQTYWYPAQSADNTLYCQCCRMEVSKCLQKPKGLLYTVTVENGGSSRTRKEHIKVEKGWSGKYLKNKENYHKRDKDRKKEKRKKDDDVDEVEDKDDMEKKEKNKKKSKKENVEDVDARYTLMEYLIKNRPGFVCAAEYRRQMLLHSRIIREQQKDDLKLNFLENNLRNSDDGKYKLFTEREMKDINKKNYKKLPEVQNKLISQRENRLKHADRLISNIFAKKVQKSVLQGRDNFPIDKPLTNL